MTQWAKDVSPENVWKEYPRPQMVRKQWVNLNGLWNYAIRPKDASQPTQWDGQILVPFAVESALSGVMKPLKPDQKLWYQRTFQAPNKLQGNRLLLHFGAVDWQCTVWVNNTKVGEHIGGYDPFNFDITDALKEGDNTLALAVVDPTDVGYQPRGKQVLKPGGIMYTAVSGIWQTVWLESVPANHIKGLKIVPDIDQGLVFVTVHTTEGGQVKINGRNGSRNVSRAEGRSGEPVELPIKNPRLWSPDSPFLYDLEVTLQDEGKEVDMVESYFGMRKTEVNKDSDGIQRLMLNNKVIFQYGPLDQGWWPDGLYTPASDKALKYDIIMTKRFGMNMARKHVKYESARWYYWCDKLGLLVWQDMPAGDSTRHADSKANFRHELKNMIDALHNFPSIVMWVPFNEGWGQHETPEIVAWLQNYDPSRPVNEASGWHNRGSGDVSDMHSYPGPGTRPVETNRAVVLGEFGGLGMPVTGHTWQAEKNWGYVSYKTSQELTDAYVGLLTQMRPLIGLGLAGAVYTQTSDVEIEVNGLMTYDRDQVKMDLKRIAQAARKLYLPPPIVKTLLPTSQHKAKTWRFTTSLPVDDWSQPNFNDSSWKSAPGGFGTTSTPGAVVGTEWNTEDIWIRRTFNLASIPSKGAISLSIHHDEDAEVYLNGKLIKKLTGYTSNYAPVSLDQEAIETLREGDNTIAVHCHQTRGGQFIDAGLSIIMEQ